MRELGARDMLEPGEVYVIAIDGVSACDSAEMRNFIDSSVWCKAVYPPMLWNVETGPDKVRTNIPVKCMVGTRMEAFAAYCVAGARAIGAQPMGVVMVSWDTPIQALGNAASAVISVPFRILKGADKPIAALLNIPFYLMVIVVAGAAVYFSAKYD